MFAFNVERETKGSNSLSSISFFVSEQALRIKACGTQADAIVKATESAVFTLSYSSYVFPLKYISTVSLSLSLWHQIYTPRNIGDLCERERCVWLVSSLSTAFIKIDGILDSMCVYLYFYYNYYKYSLFSILHLFRNFEKKNNNIIILI